MYPVTEKMKGLFDEKHRQTVNINAQLKEGNEAESIEITEADIVLGSLSVDRYSSTGENIEIGSAVAAELKFTLDNSRGKFDGISFGGARLFVRLGIKNHNDEEAPMNYMDCGYFTVDENPKPLSFISVAALDNMMRFDRKVDWSLFSFPMSIGNMVSVCCDACGVTLSPSVNFADLPNGTYEVQSMPVSAEITYRTVIQWVAEITGTCAFADWNGCLRFGWVKSTSVEIKPSNRYGSSVDDRITVTGVQIKESEEDVYFSGEKGYVFNIEGNELIQHSHAEVAENLGAVLCGFSYVPFECSCFPMPYLFPLDIVSFTDSKGNVFDTVITAHRYTLNGTSELKGAGENVEQQNYSTATPFTKRESAIINNLKKNAEKNMSRIEKGTVDMNNALLNALGLYPTVVKNEDGSVTYYYHSKENLEESVEGDVIFCLNAGGFGVCLTGWNDGNPVFSDGYDAKNGRAIWQYLCANTISASLIKAGRLESTDGSSFFDLDKGVIGITKTDDEGNKTCDAQFSKNGVDVAVHKPVPSENLFTLSDEDNEIVKKRLEEAGIETTNVLYPLIKFFYQMVLMEERVGYGVNVHGSDAEGNSYHSILNCNRQTIMKKKDNDTKVTDRTVDGVFSNGRQTFSAPEIIFLISEESECSVEDIINHLITSKANPHGVTAAQVGAAPSGYGLGTTAGQTISDCNAALLTGWYVCTDTCANTPDITQFKYASLYVVRRNSAIYQTISYLNLRAHRTGSDNGDKWDEWEWENPPMMDGVEYRTTEKYEGKPVYCKHISHTTTSTIGTSGKLTEYVIKHGISGFTGLVRIDGRHDGVYPTTLITSGGNTLAISKVDSTDILLRLNGCTFGARTWKFNLYYTK